MSDKEIEELKKRVKALENKLADELDEKIERIVDDRIKSVAYDIISKDDNW